MGLMASEGRFLEKKNFLGNAKKAFENSDEKTSLAFLNRLT